MNLMSMNVYTGEVECCGTHMLVNEYYCYILAFRELLKGCFDG